MKSKILGALAAWLLTGLVAGTASAATVVGNCDLASNSDSGIVEVFADCEPFDTSLGTLTGITYSVSARYFGSLEFKNYGTVEATRTAGTASIQGFVTDTNGFDLYLDVFGTVPVPETLLLPGQSLFVPYDATVTGSGSILSFDPLYFSSERALLFEVGVSGYPSDIGECIFFPNPPTECITIVDPLINASVSGAFTYTYDPKVVPVPEPGSLALLGLGLIGLGLSRRRKAA